MTSNDLEPPKNEVLVLFAIFGYGDRTRQSANEFFIVKRRF